MIYTLYIALAVVVFIEMLNSFLRGSRKYQIDIVVNILIFTLVVASFFVAGWMFGLLAIALRFIFAIFMRPLAARAASKAFLRMKKEEFRYWPSKGQNCKYIGLPPWPLSRISNQLGSNIDEFGRINIKNEIKKLRKDPSGYTDSHEHAMEALLDYCENQFEIKEIMDDFQISRDDLQELYNQLTAMGGGQWTCGHWVAASSIAYPKSLKYVLTLLDPNDSVFKDGISKWLEKDKTETIYNLIMHFECGAPL
jgi:hypothetical protein